MSALIVRLGELDETRLRKLLELVGGNLGVHVGAIGLEHGPFGAHLDALRHCADLQGSVDANDVILVHQDI